MDMDERDVAKWLRSINFGEYADNFIKAKVNGEMLFYLDATSFKLLGIDGLHLQRLLLEVQKLHSREVHMPKRMDEYEKQKVIGKGSFGQAVLVRRKCDGHQLVAKEVHVGAMSTKEQMDAKKEIQVLMKLTNHPNIVQYYDNFEEEGRQYIIMEYADGGDLHSLIKDRTTNNQPFSETEVLNIICQLSLALKHLHDHKILHRDLKTQNIFLTASQPPVVKLGDFGVSTILESTAGKASTFCGTPYYFSPELCKNKPYNHKSDVWALGCVAYELCTLKHAFDASNLKSLMHKIVKGKYPPIDDKYSPELRDMIDQSLCRKVKLRLSINRLLSTPIVQSQLHLMQSQLADAEAWAQQSMAVLTDFPAGAPGQLDIVGWEIRPAECGLSPTHEGSFRGLPSRPSSAKLPILTPRTSCVAQEHGGYSREDITQTLKSQVEREKQAGSRPATAKQAYDKVMKAADEYDRMAAQIETIVTQASVLAREPDTDDEPGSPTNATRGDSDSIRTMLENELGEESVSNAVQLLRHLTTVGESTDDMAEKIADALGGPENVKYTSMVMQVAAEEDSDDEGILEVNMGSQDTVYFS